MSLCDEKSVVDYLNEIDINNINKNINVNSNDELNISSSSELFGNDIRPWKNNEYKINLDELMINQSNNKVVKYLYGKICKYKKIDVKKGLKTNITYNHVSYLLKIWKRCIYCKVDLKIYEYNARDPDQYSIDRIDNTIGHVKSNIVISCYSCNIIKRNIHTVLYILYQNNYITYRDMYNYHRILIDKNIC
jgi:hypothetical protein